MRSKPGVIHRIIHYRPENMSFVHTGEAPRFSREKMQKVNLFETRQMFCDIYCLEPGQEQKVHAHAGATKFYYVIEGDALVTIGAETRRLAAGGLAWSAPDEPHGVRNGSDGRLVLLVSMAPNPNAPQDRCDRAGTDRR